MYKPSFFILFLMISYDLSSMSDDQLSRRLLDTPDKEEIISLIRRGANPNYIGQDRRYFKTTPLISAAIKNRVEATRALLENGAQIHQAYGGYTPLKAALLFLQSGVVDVLLEYHAEKELGNLDGVLSYLNNNIKKTERMRERYEKTRALILAHKENRARSVKDNKNTN